MLIMKKELKKRNNTKLDRLKEDIPIAVKIISYVIMTLLSFTCIVPLWLTISISFTDEEVLGLNGYSFFPDKFSLDAYKYVIENGKDIFQSFGVTVFITIVGVFVGLFLMSMFAYAVTRKDFPWKNQFGFFVYFTMLFHGGMVSSYIINTTVFHLRDTIWILIISGMVSAYNLMIMRTYMRTSIPDEVIESAKIDGAGEFTCFYKFALPMAVPMLATIALFMTVAYWNNWSTGLLYIVKRNDLVPIQLMLKRIENNIAFIANNEAAMATDIEAYEKNFPMESFRMALTMMVALPMLVVYPFFQKYFVKGVTVGAVKG